MGGSDIGIIIEGSFLLTETVKVQANPTWPFIHIYISIHVRTYSTQSMVIDNYWFFV